MTIEEILIKENLLRMETRIIRLEDSVNPNKTPIARLIQMGVAESLAGHEVNDLAKSIMKRCENVINAEK